MNYDFSEVFKDIIRPSGGKIILCVLDGLGGIPSEEFGGKTELEVANTPNLDRISKISAKGMHIPVDFGITPGSGPSHLALFGYDPVRNTIKRGIMEALGIGIEPEEDQVFARGNFAKCVFDNSGIKVIDRRAGRISTEINREICDLLNRNIQSVDGVEIKFYPVKEHRVCVSFRAKDISDDIGDTDPQKEGSYIKEPEIFGEKTDQKRKLSSVAYKLSLKVSEILKNNEYAQGILLRGFSKFPNIQKFEDKWKLKALSIASYPMYRGLTKILGMDIADVKTGALAEQVKILKDKFHKYDFFYFHFKKTDSSGEDGNFRAKIKAIEEFDSFVDEIFSAGADVIAITGDHSTPSVMAGHSFHPVPLLIYSKNRIFRDGEGRFTERDCMKGTIGLIYATKILPLLLAFAGRLDKFGA